MLIQRLKEKLRVRCTSNLLVMKILAFSRYGILNSAGNLRKVLFIKQHSFCKAISIFRRCQTRYGFVGSGKIVVV